MGGSVAAALCDQQSGGLGGGEGRLRPRTVADHRRDIVERWVDARRHGQQCEAHVRGQAVQAIVDQRANGGRHRKLLVEARRPWQAAHGTCNLERNVGVAGRRRVQSVEDRPRERQAQAAVDQLLERAA